MLRTVKKWGNSAAIRIPASVMKAAHLQLNDKVEVRAEGGCISIEPVLENTLANLIAGITPDNLHGAANFGSSVGNEMLSCWP